MTTVVAARYNGTVHMAADRQIYDENGHCVYASKLFRVGDAVIGGSGDLAPIISMRYIPDKVLTFPTGSNVDRYMALSFPAFIKEWVKERGVQLTDFSLLIGVKGNIYHYEDYEVFPVSKYHAIGSGSPFALGYLYSKPLSDRYLPDIVAGAVGCASHFDMKTGGGIDYEANT
jgi:ATP-dependent protease HslVU (ClpYQ) peptidase subunit